MPVLGNNENAKEVVNQTYLPPGQLLLKKIIESVPDFHLTTGSVFIDETQLRAVGIITEHSGTIGL